MQNQEIKYISIDNLRQGEENVRRDPASEAADAELLASIRAHGLLHPLAVRPIEDAVGEGENGIYSVSAGNRRLRAFQAIQEEDGGDPFEVPCIVVAHARAVEVSLAENTARVPMHPADQVAAFGQLAAAGATAEEIGNRFGYQADTVKKRLRLGALPERIIDTWRQGEMEEAAVRALATTQNVEEAGHIFDHLQKTRGRVDAWSVRQALEDRRMSPTDRLVRYVTVKAYEKAGGVVEETLFPIRRHYGEEPEATAIMDPTLVERIALEKLEKAAKRAGKGWKWHLPLLTWTYEDEEKFEAITKTPAPFTEEEQARLDAIPGEMEDLDIQREELAKKDGDENLAEIRKLHGEQSKLRQEHWTIEQAAEKRGDWTAEEKAIAGVVASIDRNGRVETRKGLVTEEDLTAWRKIGGDKAAPASSSSKGKGKKKKAGAYAAAVVDDLRLMRGAAVRRALAGNPRLARDVLTFMLARTSRYRGLKRTVVHKILNVQLLRLGGEGRPDYGSGGSPRLRADDCSAGVLEPFAPKAVRDLLEQKWMVHNNQGTAFRGFLELTPGARDKLLAYLVADLLRARLRGEHPAYEEVVKILDIAPAESMIEFARDAGVYPLPVDVFWSRLTKVQLLDMAGKELGAKWVDEHRKLKKAALVEAVASATADRPWLPEGF